MVEEVEQAVEQGEQAVEPAGSEAAPAGRDRHRARSIVATVLGVLTVLMLVVAAVAVWARATVLRPEPIAEWSATRSSNRRSSSALAERITIAVVDAVDLARRWSSRAPRPAQGFAPTIASGATNGDRSRTDERARHRPEVQNAIVDLVERAHAVAMRLLEGDGLADGVTVVDGAVTLNLLPLVNRGLGAVQDLGLLSDVTLPTMEAGGDPAQQEAQLEQALGRDLPDGFGQIVVYQSDSLANAQTNLQTAQRILGDLQAGRVARGDPRRGARRGDDPRRLASLAGRARARHRDGRGDGRAALGGPPGGRHGARPDREAGGKAAIRRSSAGAAESLLRLAGVVLLVGLAAATVAVLRRRQWRADLVLVVAVAVGVAIPALAGLSIWTALIGLVVGIAVPFVARWLLPPPAGPPTAVVPPPTPSTDDDARRRHQRAGDAGHRLIRR